MKKIPFTKITFDENEEKAVINCMKSGWVVLGYRTLEFEQKFAEYVGAKYSVFVDSGTSALFLSLQASKDYHDEVTIPSLTFVSDAEIVKHSGKKIIFADVNLETLCIDDNYASCLPTNFAGAKAKCKAKIIDSCHRIEKDDVKNSDAMWCYSFYATKNMSTGQGGMIALNDKDKYEWLLKARDHGMTKGTKQRYEGKDPTYDIQFVGYRVKGDDLRAVIGIEQLKKLPWITKRRNEIVQRYNKNLGLNRVGNHLYWCLVKEREKFINIMHEQNIGVSIHFLPLHKMTAFKNQSDIHLPNTVYVGDRIVSLPMFPQMTDNEVDIVSDAVLKTKLLINN